MLRKRSFRGKRGFRRKRVKQGTWFPIAGDSWSDGESFTWNEASITDITGNVGTHRYNGVELSVHPITQDYTIDPAGSAGENVNLRPTLRDFTEGQDYLLKRLVGNIVIFTELGANAQGNFAPTDQWTHVQVGAGFFVARAQDADQSLPDLTQDEIDPLGAQNIQNSWIWRRTWILDNPQNDFIINTNQRFSWDQSSNRQFSDLVGPHFDTKSRRRIKREERLWFALGAIGWDGARGAVGGQVADQPFLKYNLDVRLFGKMMPGRTSSTF